MDEKEDNNSDHTISNNVSNYQTKGRNDSMEKDDIKNDSEKKDSSNNNDTNSNNENPNMNNPFGENNNIINNYNTPQNNNNINNNLYEKENLQKKRKKDPLDNKEPIKTDKTLIKNNNSFELNENNENLNLENSNLIENNDKIDIRRNSEIVPLNFDSKNYSFNIYKDLNNIEIVYISREVDIFRIYHSYDCLPYAFKIYHIENESVNVLFTVNENFILGKCCQDVYCNSLCSFFFFTYLCNKLIYFQLNYTKNGKPFLTQGINYEEGCYCCLLPLGCKLCNVLNTLHLRINKNPDNPSKNIGINIGKTVGKKGCCMQKNCTCCYCCFYNVEIYDENNNLRWSIGLKKKYLKGENKCKCFGCDCGCCFSCCGECYSDFILGIFNKYGKIAGKVIIPYGCCSRKLEKNCCCKCCCGGCCSIEKTFSYYQIEFPKNISSLDKFYIINGVIMYELISKIINSFT